MIILDASVLIAHAEPADNHHGHARRLLAKYRHHQFAASAITLAEFLVFPARAGALAAARQALETLEIQPLGIDAGASWRLAELRAASGLKLPDCCVLYAAQQQPDGLLATFDGKLAQQAQRLQIPTAD